LSQSRAGYLIGLLVGLVFVATMLGVPVILGTGGLWRFPSGDVAQNLTGHLAYQTGGWSWPLLDADNLFVPRGFPIAMTDSNPLMSVIAKLGAFAWGAPRNLLGVWLALCFLLQPVASVYAVRGFGARRLEISVAAALFAVAFPALLARSGHVNLLGHFYLLVALGIAVRDARLAAAPGMAWRFLLLLAAIISHPYIFVFCALVLSTPAWSATFLRRPAWWRDWLRYLAPVAAVIAIYTVLTGTLGGGDTGFGYYSMNLFSPVWPHGSFFFPNAQMLDATGGQYEGYNYLGLGTLIAAALALPRLRTLSLRTWGGLLFVVLCLTLLALSSDIYAGPMQLVSFGKQPWRQLFGFVQASGRAFWVVGYCITFAALAAFQSWPRRRAALVLGALAALQLLDTSPVHQAAATAFATDSPAGIYATQFPPESRFLSQFAPCSRSALVNNDALRLAALRHGIALAYIRASRSPAWFNCDIGASDTAELPIAPGELRAFPRDITVPSLRDSVFDTGAHCTSADALLLCGHSVPASATSQPATAPVPTLEAGTVQAAKLPLGFGWVLDQHGVAWSEGPRATLIFRVPPGTGTLRLDFDIAAISFRAGSTRDITLTAGNGAPHQAQLPDGTETTTTLNVTQADLVGNNVVRVAIDTHYPVDPAKRGLTAPVRRAAVRLLRLTLSTRPNG
jgi:hypothetical protein